MGVRRSGRFLGLVLSVYVATVVGVAVTAYAWPDRPFPSRADAIICLGGGTENGRLRRGSHERAVTCADVFAAGGAARIVFTGIEAAAPMAEVAVARGVPRTAIVIEAESRSTLQNALFTAQIVPTSARAIIVTDAYHLPRSWVSFRVMGFEDIALVASATPRLSPESLLREAAAIWFNVGRVIAWWATPWLADDARAALLT